MRFEVEAREAGELGLWLREGEGRIGSSAEFLELLAACPAPTLALRREDLDESFFELRSGLAGDCLQKVSNYRRRLAILGDFSAEGSRALRDFIRESNGTGQVVFATDLEAAAALLR